jgi:FkbM family methyltransferase
MSEFNRWFADNGDATLRLDYRIGISDVVFDCGAYHGDWSRKIYDRYRCRIVAFEPVSEYYAITVRELAGIGAYVYHAGIGPDTTSCVITVNGDASSTLTQGGHQEQIHIISIDDVVREQSLPQIRLMKLNIEGAEYDLLDHMLDTGIISRVADLQIQFHRFIPDAEARRNTIRERLRQTHYLTYDYEFVWENWRRAL